jgi:hypothetical protein
MTPLVMALLLPVSTVYGTYYLYESLPAYLIILSWLLLLRWNRQPATWTVILCAFCLGVAGHQKLPYVLIIIPFLLCFLLFHGLRALSLLRLGACLLAACLGPLAYVLASYQYDPTFSRLSLLSHHRAGLISGISTVWNSAVAPENAMAPMPIGRIVLLVALVAFMSAKVYESWKHPTRATASPFASAVLLLALPSMACLYQFHPASSPALQFLPFLSIVIASAVIDLWHYITVRIRLRGIRTIATTSVAVTVAVAAGWQWRCYSLWANAYPAHFTLAEQQSAVSRLVAIGAREPYMLSSYFNGTFEFLSDGQVRPVYLDEYDDGDVDWGRILKSMRGVPSFFLFSDEPLSLDSDATSAIHRNAFLAAAPGVERIVITAADGRRMFSVYSLEQAARRPPLASSPASRRP